MVARPNEDSPPKLLLRSLSSLAKVELRESCCCCLLFWSPRKERPYKAFSGLRKYASREIIESPPLLSRSEGE